MLDLVSRKLLARTMAKRVVSGLVCSDLVDQVFVVSAEPEMKSLCFELGVELLPDPGQGLNRALAMSVPIAASGTDDLVIVHSDIPLFSTKEFNRIARLHLAGRRRKMTLVLDGLRQGTNLRFLRPGDSIPPLFGPGSADRHLKAAKAVELETMTVNSLSLSLDCDRPADLFQYIGESRLVRTKLIGDGLV